MLQTLAGPNAWAQLLFFFSVGIIGLLLLATCFTILYHRYWYAALMRPKFDESYRPRCSIILPCKGVPKDLDKNLKAFLDQDYENTEIIFCVEDEKDPAYPVITDLIRDQPHASVVVAGHATRCAQKNFNMLAAIKKSRNPDVYVFADADISPGKNWLHELVIPLSRPSIAATTGFRWLYVAPDKVRTQAHWYANVFMFTLFAFVCFLGNVGLWGGSMAIRRKDFEDMGVADLWSNSCVDDMSLSRIIIKKKKKAILVPPCITHSDDTIHGWRGATLWFERQCMFLKACHRLLWIMATPLAVGFLFVQLWLAAAIIARIFSASAFYAVGGGAAVTMLMGELFVLLLISLIDNVPHFGRIFLLHIFFRVVPLAGFCRTLFAKKIYWGGIRYTLDFKGRVVAVEHPEPAPS